jgi:hypothetical protein
MFFVWIIRRRLNFVCRRFGTRTRAIYLSHTRPRPPCESLPFHYMSYNRTHPYSVTLLPIGLGYFRAKPSPVWIPQLFSNLVIIHLLAYIDGTDRVFRNVRIYNSDSGELPRRKHTLYLCLKFCTCHCKMTNSVTYA